MPFLTKLNKMTMSKIIRVQVKLDYLLLNYYLYNNAHNSILKILEALAEPACFFFAFNSARYFSPMLLLPKGYFKVLRHNTTCFLLPKILPLAYGCFAFRTFPPLIIRTRDVADFLGSSFSYSINMT